MTAKRTSFPLLLFYILILYLVFFLIASPFKATSSCIKAVELCLQKLIPSLFPFLVLNDLMIRSGLFSCIGKYIGKPFSKAFNLSAEASLCFISGLIFGFPLGTKTVCTLYDQKSITKSDAERLVCFCSNTGPAFVLGIATMCLETRKAAYIIYICQALSAFVVGLFVRPRKSVSEKYAPKKQSFTLSNIPDAITSSFLPMMNICCFVCFFAIVSASVENLVLFFCDDKTISVLLIGFFEITNGISRINGSFSPLMRSALCAFLVGWSGVSVILQSINIMSKSGIRCKKYIVCKLIQGILCFIFTVVGLKIFKLY